MICSYFSVVKKIHVGPVGYSGQEDREVDQKQSKNRNYYCRGAEEPEEDGETISERRAEDAAAEYADRYFANAAEMPKTIDIVTRDEDGTVKKFECEPEYIVEWYAMEIKEKAVVSTEPEVSKDNPS